MNIPGIQWTPGEAASLNDFLNTPVGRKWLTLLMTRKPKVDFASTERAALTGAFAAGYEHLLLNEMGIYRNPIGPEPNASAKTIDMVKD